MLLERGVWPGCVWHGIQSPLRQRRQKSRSPAGIVDVRIFLRLTGPSDKSLRTALCSVLLDGQSVASLEAASLQNILAIGIAHSDAKAVCLVALSVVWLEGALHLV